MKKLSKLTALVGSLFLAALFFNTASADANPFAQQSEQVQTIAGDDSKCGDEKKDKKEEKCGEGKCGDKKDKKCGDKKDEKEEKCGDKKDHKEKKCGEGKCGGK